MNAIDPYKLIYLDIETVPQKERYVDLCETERKLWNKKAERIKNKGESVIGAYKRAGIYAEFGKIVCISVGVFHKKADDTVLRVKSFYGTNEFELLQAFTKMIFAAEKHKEVMLCAHNGKEFDFPYISRRVLVNRVALPNTFQLAGKKPWEINHYDTMELWKFGDFKNFTSLELLTSIFNIPSPKNDMDGSEVAYYYYKLKDIASIKKYCENDVIALANVMLAFQNKPLVQNDFIEKVD